MRRGYAWPPRLRRSRCPVLPSHPGEPPARDSNNIPSAHAREGALHLHVRHTSASLTIQENADPDVLADLMTALDGFAPQDAPYRHASEGPDDMPAHIRTMLTATSLTVPVIGGKLTLGTWQAIYLVEHRTAPHAREIVMQFVGKASSPSP